MKKNKYILTVVLMTLLLSNQIKAQSDTTFWFAAPDISVAGNLDRPIVFRISTYQSTSIVTVSQPANVSFNPISVTIPPYSTQTIDLTNYIDNIECVPGNVVQNRGLKVHSTNKIAVYYEVNVNGNNPEIFSLKGKNSLGTEFFISAQNFLNNTILSGFTPRPVSSFNIVSSEDNTTVNITPSHDIIGHSANNIFTINLNKGQTYAAIASSYLAAEHLGGSYVTSTKPIAITISDDLLEGGDGYGGMCEDLAGDQTVPIRILGTEYIAIKSFLSPPYDKIFITATQNGTLVKQDGLVVGTINRGQSISISVSNLSTYIETSYPAYAYQLAGSGCEAGAAILPKIDCTGSSSVSVARSSDESLSITLLVKNGGQNNFLINNTAGIITGAQFSTVPGTGGIWYFAKINLPLSNYPNGSIIKIDNPSSYFQMGFLQGLSRGLSFGYFSDYDTLKANVSASTMHPCAGSNVGLNADAISSGIYNWAGPNGFTSINQSPILTNVNANNSGLYIANITVPGCGIYTDSISINVNNNFSTIINQSICEGQSYEGYTASGQHVDTFAAISGCDSIRTLNLSIKPKSITTLSKSICEGDSYFGHSSIGTYIDTFTSANGCDSIRTLNLTVNPKIINSINKTICKGDSFEGFINSGIYTNVFVGSNGCDSTRTLNLLVQNPPAPDLGLSRDLCSVNNLLLTPGSFDTYLWQDGSSQSTYSVSLPGEYSVKVTNVCGVGSDSVFITHNSCDIIFPTVFSPNNDGINDIFKALNADNAKSFRFEIFNRWGQKVYETSNNKLGWNGTFKGASCDPGTFVWYCSYILNETSKSLKGFVVLVR